MKFRQIDQSSKTFFLVFQTGDELAKGLLEFAEQEKLSAASFKAVGALSSIRLGWFSCLPQLHSEAPCGIPVPAGPTIGRCAQCGCGSSRD